MKYSPKYYASFLYQQKDMNALIALLEKHWVIDWLPHIAKEYRKIQDKREGVTHIRLESAYQLSENQKEEILTLLKKYVGAKEIRLESILDKNVIGGVHIESDELLFQGSLSDKLDDLALNFR